MIIVGTPTRELVHGTMVVDLIGLLTYSPGTEWRPCFGTIIPNNRTLLVHHAAQAGASHILFIDSDMRFPRDALERLLKANKDIIGANCHQRTRDEWTARKNGKFISSEDKTDVEQIDTIGFGVTLIDMKVFVDDKKAVPPDAFAMPFDPTSGTFTGEDVNFCNVARKAGFSVWVDHDLSKEVKHSIGVES